MNSVTRRRMRVIRYMICVFSVILLVITASSPALRAGKIHASEQPQITLPGPVPSKDDLPEIVMEVIATGPNPDLPAVEAEMNRILEEKAGCRLHLFETGTSDHAAIIYRQIPSNSADIIVSGFSTPLPELKSKGIITDLNSLPEEAPTLFEKCGILLNACRLDGDIYCIPQNLYPASQATLFFQNHLADSFGVTIPENITYSYEEIEDIFKDIKKSDYPGYALSGGDGYMLALLPVGIETFGDPLHYGYGVLSDASPDRIYDFYESEEFSEYCRTMQNWYEKGYVEKDTLLTGSNLMDAILNGRVAACMIMNNLTVCLAGYLEGYTGYPVEPLHITGDMVTEFGFAVTRQSQNPALCMRVLELLYTDPELINLLNYGIEGLHYERVPGYGIRRLAGPDGSFTYGNFIFFMGDPALGCSTRIPEEDYDDMICSYSTQNAQISPAFGYTFDPTSVSVQAAGVREVIELYRPGLIIGCTDTEKLLPEFIKALKDAGIDDVIKENQRQYDLFREGLKQ